jgi:hypothetical protein
MREGLGLHLKNIIGARTDRKVVVFSVDDYGNVRVDSKKAREQMDRQGLKILSRFDAFDSLETESDLQILFETLCSVKDKNGNHAVFTAFAIPANIDFEKMEADNYANYYYEWLPKTFSKLKGYENVWSLWKEGMSKKILIPQFHGREHLNLKLFEEGLQIQDHETITALRNRSYTSISNRKYSTISFTAAFDFWDVTENNRFTAIIEDGLSGFENVFGMKASHFNAPGGRENPVIHNVLKKNGIRYIDAPLLKYEHQGKGKFKRIFNYTGKRNDLDQLLMVRNVVFEPSDNRGFDWVNAAMKQIEVAFKWKRPAVISSHRVNFCGHINEVNRAKGIEALRQLLNRIVKRWPDVEFMAANELAALLDQKH